MDNETFHNNVSLEKTDSHLLSIVKTRLWSYQLMSLNWLNQSPIPLSTNVQNGLGLIIINTLATSIEGIITNLIAEHLFEKDLERVEGMKNCKLIGWHKKKKKYNDLFFKKIENYNSYKSIENLFSLRNCISHGETHLEISSRDIGTNIKSTIQSVGESYSRVRSFLMEKKIIQETEISSNINVLWTLSIAHFFFRETFQFLNSVITENESPNKMGIQKEFETVLSNRMEMLRKILPLPSLLAPTSAEMNTPTRPTSAEMRTLAQKRGEAFV